MRKRRGLDKLLSTQSILQFGDGGNRERKKGDAATCRSAAKKLPCSLDHYARLSRAGAGSDERRACMLYHPPLLIGRLEWLGDHLTKVSIASFR